MTNELAFIPGDIREELEKHSDVREALQLGSYFRARHLLLERGYGAEFVKQLEVALGEHLRTGRIAG